MDLVPATAAAGPPASGRCTARAKHLVRVKFVGLPIEPTPGDALRETRASGQGRGPVIDLIFRVIDRLVAARP